MRYTMKGFVLASAAVIAAIFAITALAGSGGQTGANVTYTATAGEVNNILVTDLGGNKIRIQDLGAIGDLAATGGCDPATAPPVIAIDCTVPGGTTLAISTKDGNDTVTIDASVGGVGHLSEIDVDGGAGNDRLENDSTVATTFTGGPGDDYIQGRSGGADTVSYATAPGPTGVNVNLRDQGTCPAPPISLPPTGCATGDGSDTIQQIKNVTGSTFDDTIQGTTGANGLDGGDGVDTVSYAGAGGRRHRQPHQRQRERRRQRHDPQLRERHRIFVQRHDHRRRPEQRPQRRLGPRQHRRQGRRRHADRRTGQRHARTAAPAGAEAPTRSTTRARTASCIFAGPPDLGVAVDLPGGQVIAQVISGFPFCSNDAGTDNISNVENTVGSNFSDAITGTSDANVITGGAGNDAIQGNGGADILNGGGGDDAIAESGNANNAVLNGNAGNDTLTGGGSGNDTLTAGDGDDILRSGGANDTMDGGTGTNTANYSLTTVPVAADGVKVDLATGAPQATPNNNGQPGNDTLTNIQNVVGSNGADVLSGDSGANRLDGGLGDDTIDGRAGSDTLIGGGALNDTVTFTDAAAAVNVDLTGGVASGIATGTDSLDGFETATGSNFADTLTTAGSGNALNGLGGDDSITITGGGTSNNATGGDGNDSITSSTSGTLDGLAGNDTISETGASGATLTGGDGNDSLTGGDGNDGLDGGLGNDTLAPGLGNDGTSVNPVDGGNGNDTIDYSNVPGPLTELNLHTGAVSGAGFDTLKADTIENAVGTAGDDDITGTSDANVITGGAGDDKIHGNGGSDVLSGGDGVDTIDEAGLANNAVLNGDAGGDTLSGGGSGSDTLNGGDGDDKLTSGAANDTMNGGAGTNTVDYSRPLSGPVDVNLRAGTGTGDGTDSLVSIQNVTGSPANDTIAGNAGDNVLDGGNGVDLVSYAAAPAAVILDLATQRAVGDGSDVVKNFENATGSSFDDTLTGDVADNMLNGGPGNDTVKGAGGNDQVNGDEGNDTLLGRRRRRHRRATRSTAATARTWPTTRTRTSFVAGRAELDLGRGRRRRQGHDPARRRGHQRLAVRRLPDRRRPRQHAEGRRRKRPAPRRRRRRHARRRHRQQHGRPSGPERPAPAYP